MIRLIALDMDGTTMNSENRLSKGNKAAIRRAIAQGVEVVPASGRVLGELPEEVLAIPGIRWAVTSNGAAVVDLRRDKTIHKNLISQEKVFPLLDFLDQYPVLVELYIEGRPYLSQYQLDHLADYGVPETYFDLFSRSRVPVDSLRQFLTQSGKEVEKLNLFIDDPTLKEQLRLRLACYKHFAIASSMETNLEVSSLTATKGDSLLILCRHLGLPMNQAMAVGDSGNDLSMLMAAGVSVAMGNAPEEVRSVAHFVTRSNDEDGVAYALEKFIFSKNQRSFL